jgi:acetyltransferase
VIGNEVEFMVLNTVPTAGEDLPAGYPLECVESITLRDGIALTIRPIRPDDAPRLQHGLTHLSPTTIYLRFLQAANQLSDLQAQRFAVLDYQTQMALVAVFDEDGEEHMLGVARYALVDPHDPQTAEVAVVVRDDFQRHGIGTKLLESLIHYARQHGVKTFVATVIASNTPVMHFIWKGGFHYEREMVEPGVFQIRIMLDERHIQPT